MANSNFTGAEINNILSSKVIDSTAMTADAQWIKFKDGTMLLCAELSVTPTLSDATESGLKRAVISGNFTFPVSFVSVPFVTATNVNGDAPCMVASIVCSATAIQNIKLYFLESDNPSNKKPKISIIALGNWK